MNAIFSIIREQKTYKRNLLNYLLLYKVDDSGVEDIIFISSRRVIYIKRTYQIENIIHNIFGTRRGRVGNKFISGNQNSSKSYILYYVFFVRRAAEIIQLYYGPHLLNTFKINEFSSRRKQNSNDE